MKSLILLILLSFLLAADYALAQQCPCDTEELLNGLSGNEIVDLLCPGGKIAQGNIWSANPGVVGISGEIGNDMGVAYQVITSPPECEITDFVNKAVFVPLSDQEVESCRQRLIVGCRLFSSIPTLSEWGMILMAGVLGIIGLILTARHRKVTA